MAHDGSAMSRLWLIWVVGLAAYMVGVMQRTSFGVAGLDAAARFDATPAVLSGFVVLQLLVYASLQVPAGVLLDRFGARTLVVTGALVMAAGQLLLAVADGLTGQLGQVLSAIPFAALLHGPGWATAFGSAAALGVAVALAVLAVLRNRPPGAPAPPPAATPREVLQSLEHAWREPGTRLGLWTHTGTQFSGTVFALLWGVPY